MTAEVSRDEARAGRHEEINRQALSMNAGSRSFRGWKENALEELIHLANRSPRMEILQADLSGDLNVVYGVQMPVPRIPRDGKLVLGDRAIFHFHFADEWRFEQPPGWAPLGVFEPLDIWHPNARPHMRAALCLGHLPAGIPPKEIVLIGYFLLTLQDIALDERDPEGVLNAQASEYYRCHPEYLPLTRAGLFDPWSPQEETHE